MAVRSFLRSAIVAITLGCGGAFVLATSNPPDDAAPAKDEAASKIKDVADTPKEPKVVPPTPVETRKLAEERKAREAAKKRGEITFDDLKFEMEKGGEFKPEMLTAANKELDKKVWKLRGFILPNVFSRTKIKEFVLVRDNQECCFGPGAALFDCVMVTMEPGKTIDFSTRIIAVKGKLEIDTESFQYEDDGGYYAIYKMTAEEVK